MLFRSTELAENESGKPIKFPKLFIAAATLFGINLVLVLFFYFSPKVMGETVKADDSNQYAIAKASAFEERVKETRYIARAVEKVRPMIEVSVAPQDPDMNGTDLSVASYTNSNDSAYQPASYTMNTGDRPVASGSEASHLTASLSARGSGLD